jgi:hypothetical protein
MNTVARTSNPAQFKAVFRQLFGGTKKSHENLSVPLEIRNGHLQNKSSKRYRLNQADRRNAIFLSQKRAMEHEKNM